MDGLAQTPIPSNPLGWKRSLHRCLADPRGELRDEIIGWLLHQGWRHRRGAWQDPLDLDRHPLFYAIRLQCVREAQSLLQPRGWQLTGGCRMGDSAWWGGEVFEVALGGERRFCSLRTALAREGLLQQPPPAFAQLITRPPLRFVRGGKCA